jgi:hypothetical protein
MVSVFISYAREDRSQAAELAQLLEGAGYVVWWDWHLVGGSDYRKVISRQLADAEKVIVLWSATSVNSAFVIDEAQEAKEENKLIPIVIDASRPPLGFRDIHALHTKAFHAVADAIFASIDGKIPVYASLTRRKAHKLAAHKLAYGVAAAAVAMLCLSTALMYPFKKPDAFIKPIYKAYSSSELGVTFEFPNNILSLDDTQRKEKRSLTLLDGEGQTRVIISRTPLPDLKDVKLAQQHEKEELEKQSYKVTYVAPEHDPNWKNWYVLSALKKNDVFYVRRWYVEDSVVSIAFYYPLALKPTYDELISTIIQKLVYTATSPKIDP